MEIGFILKKTLSYFLEPFGMVLALLLFALYFLFTKRENRAKILLSLGVAMMFMYSYPPFTNYLISNLENQYPKYEYQNDVAYIHVLGSGHNTDREQPLSSQVGSASIKRDIEGIIIHSKMPDSKIIFTGYAGETDVATAQMNANLAMSLGVDEASLIVNKKPKDTKEEALFTKSIVGDKAFILVTSASHMPRSMMLFESLGLHPIPAPTNYYKNSFNGYLDAPSLREFKKSQIAMHEYIGILWSRLKASI